MIALDVLTVKPSTNEHQKNTKQETQNKTV